METTIDAVSESMPNSLLIGILVAVIGGFTLGILIVTKGEKIMNAHAPKTPKRDRGEILFFCGIILCLLVPVIGGGIFLSLEGSQRDEARDSIVATIEEEHGLKDLVLAEDGEKVSLCEEGDEYVIQDYLWRDLSETSPTLVTGKIAKSAEEDGSCTYTVFPGETMP